MSRFQISNAQVNQYRDSGFFVVDELLDVDEIDLLRSQKDAWAIRLANAPTLPRELKAEERYVFIPARFTHMSKPTLFLVGGESPARELENARAIAGSLPSARVSVLPGQQHAAMYTDPDLFLQEVLAFLKAPEQRRS